MHREKVADIKRIPTPTDKERVRRFLRFSNYLAKFMPNLAAVSEPLRWLVQKDAEFEWRTRGQEDAFREIKDIETTDQ